MHRDYESNAPIKFYCFDASIEISNAGGLYGKARPENFPNENDYRNPTIAEAMKVLGFVNRFNRGISRVQVELKENENPQAVFEFDKPGTFGVIVKDALFEAESKEETRDKIIQLILTDKNITAKKLANKIGITEKGVEYHLSKLKTDKVLKRRKGRKGGYWEIINNL